MAALTANEEEEGEELVEPVDCNLRGALLFKALIAKRLEFLIDDLNMIVRYVISMG
jgi:hypothetical protein